MRTGMIELTTRLTNKRESDWAAFSERQTTTANTYNLNTHTHTIEAGIACTSVSAFKFRILL